MKDIHVNVCEYLEERLTRLEKSGEDLWRNWHLSESLNKALNTHTPKLSEIEEQGLLTKSIGGNFSYTEAENRKRTGRVKYWNTEHWGEPHILCAMKLQRLPQDFPKFTDG